MHIKSMLVLFFIHFSLLFHAPSIHPFFIHFPYLPYTIHPLFMPCVFFHPILCLLSHTHNYGRKPVLCLFA